MVEGAPTSNCGKIERVRQTVKKRLATRPRARTGRLSLSDTAYGGAVITNVGTGNPNVKALVYIAAYALDENESVGAANDLGGHPEESLLLANIIPSTAERVMAARAGAHIIEINSSHVAMISHPGVTTRLILKAATSH